MGSGRGRKGCALLPQETIATPTKGSAKALAVNVEKDLQVHCAALFGGSLGCAELSFA